MTSAPEVPSTATPTVEPIWRKNVAAEVATRLRDDEQRRHAEARGTLTVADRTELAGLMAAVALTIVGILVSFGIARLSTVQATVTPLSLVLALALARAPLPLHLRTTLTCERAFTIATSCR